MSRDDIALITQTVREVTLESVPETPSENAATPEPPAIVALYEKIQQSNIHLYTLDGFIMPWETAQFQRLIHWSAQKEQELQHALRQHTSSPAAARRFAVPCCLADLQWLWYILLHAPLVYYNRGLANYSDEQLKHYHQLCERAGLILGEDVILDEWARRLVNDGWQDYALPAAGRQIWVKVPLYYQAASGDYWSCARAWSPH